MDLNKKGFTLIELLAVILILGIIALIAIPTVNSVIEQSRKGAFENTIANLTKELENECMEDLLNGDSGIIRITFENGKATPNINMKGKLPESGYAITNSECKTRIVVSSNNYIVEKNFTDEKPEVKNTKEISENTKEIIVSRLTTSPSTADYNNIKSGANENNSILVKVHAAGKTFSAAGDTFADTKSSHKWMITVHGFTMSESGIPKDPFVSMGYNVVAPRMHYWGIENTVVNEDHSWGWNERKDLHTIINYIISIDKDAQIVIFGGSMGAATVSMLSGDILPTNVKAIIADSGYIDLKDQAKYLATQKETLEGMAPTMGIDLASLNQNELESEIYTYVKDMLSSYGYNADQISAINQVRNATVPMLFMHGTGDTLVDPASAQKFYDAATLVPTKDIFITEGACHTCASYMPEYRDAFYAKIQNFLTSIGM